MQIIITAAPWHLIEHEPCISGHPSQPGNTYTRFAKMILIYGERKKCQKGCLYFFCEYFSRNRDPEQETITDALYRLRYTGSVAQDPEQAGKKNLMFK